MRLRWHRLHAARVFIRQDPADCNSKHDKQREGYAFAAKSFLFLRFHTRLLLPLLGSFLFCYVPRLRLCPFPRFLLFWRIPVLWLLGFSEDILCFFRWVRRSFSRAWNYAHHKTHSLFIFLAKWHLNKIARPDAFILCEI